MISINDVKKEIKMLAGNNAEFYDKLNPTAKPSAGVRVPDLRKLAKKIAKEDYRFFLENNPLDTFEMEMLQAAVLGYAKDDVDIILKYASEFVPLIHDWAVNDMFCQNFKIARKYPEEVFDFLMKYRRATNEFESRVVSVLLMSHFLNDEYVDKVIDVLNELNTDDYYSKMGVAWAIATVMAKYPQKTIKYMKSKKNKLDDWTYNKAIQKMKESYRVDRNDLEELLPYKR